VEKPFLLTIEYMGFMILGRQKYIQLETLVPEPSAFDVEMPIEKLKRHKLPSIEQIPKELIKPGGIELS
jgi:hypothetical protein